VDMERGMGEGWGWIAHGEVVEFVFEVDGAAGRLLGTDRGLKATLVWMDPPQVLYTVHCTLYTVHCTNMLVWMDPPQYLLKQPKQQHVVDENGVRHEWNGTTVHACIHCTCMHTLYTHHAPYSHTAYPQGPMYITHYTHHTIH
jgi:hypothetical protein